MTPSSPDLKSALRKQLREELQRFSPAQRVAASEAICQRLAEHEVWKTAGAILCFAPRSDEPDIFPLVRRGLGLGKTLALPQFVVQTGVYRACQITDPEADLCAGTFGIREPAPHCGHLDLNQLDLILVPGLAFDRLGRRLGRGRGFYDRLLAGVRATKCGVAFDEQLKSEIPVESHDVLLDCMVTPSCWLVFSGRQRHGDDLVG